MAATIDTRVVLRAMLDHPAAFPLSQNEIEEAARKALPKELKSKTISFEALKQIFLLAGSSNISILIDDFKATEIAGLIKKVDPNNKFAKLAQVTDNLFEARAHVIDLANGKCDLTAIATSPAKPKPQGASISVDHGKKNKSGELLESKVHSGKGKTTGSKNKS